MLIAMTGATGLLGRNLLLEIIKQNYKNLSELEVFIFGRSANSETLHKKIMGILSEEVFDYINDKDVEKDELIKILSDRIKCFEFNLGEPDNKISDDDLKKLSSKEIDFFFHVASLTDFRDGYSVRQELENTNVIGTKQVLEIVKKAGVKEFSYVSSAYVCGLTSGKVDPNYINFEQKFRNPYEITKLKAECYVRDFCEKNSIRFRIFRPSTICGRLMENKIGATPKFDVFYGWAIFFAKHKIKATGTFEGDFKIDIRFRASHNSGLNIVPVDFAAKVIYRVSLNGDSENSYHLVNKNETPHDFYFFEILKSMKINNVKMQDQIPNNKNKLEDFYYKTVGKVFDPYISCPSIEFDSSNLDQICDKFDLRCPDIGKENFSMLMDYAKEKKFGLN